MTAPVRDGDIVLGKFLGAWFYYSVLLLLTLVYQIILLAITQPDLGHAISAYIGIWLYGGEADQIMHSVRSGRNGVMPAHEKLLSEDKIHIITAYVYGLSR